MKRIEYIIHDTFVTCVCKNGDKFIIDKEDLDLINGYSCYIHRDSVIINIPKTGEVALARFLVNATPNSKIKYKNRNFFDCRKSNIYNGNVYTDFGNYYSVDCFDGQIFYIDKDSYDLVRPYRWHVDKQGYVLGKVNGKTIKIHRFLMDVLDNPSVEVDHINRNPKDNRMSNLRLSNRKLNMQNTGIPKNNTSGIKGVYWHNAVNKWAAQIVVDQKRMYLGSFETKDEASIARKKAEKLYFI